MKLNQKSMKSLEIILPLKEEINRFETTVKPWVDKILFNSDQIKKIEQIRDILLPKLITGTVKININ